MFAANLRVAAEQVARLARRQGHVTAREIRAELARLELNEDLWKAVLSEVRPPLQFRGNRYHYPTANDAVRSQLDKIREAVRELIHSHQEAAAKVERRGEDRLDFIQPVKVHTEDGRTFTLLSRDLSSTGIRLVGTKRLLGQKVRVEIPGPEPGETVTFMTRVLWTCAIGDDLFENGGNFLAIEE